MRTTLCLVIIIWPLLAKANSNLVYEITNGWIPVDSETVYEQIKRQNIQIPTHISTHDIQVLHTDINSLQLHNAIKSKQDELQEKLDVKRKENSEIFIENCEFGDCQQQNNLQPTKITHPATNDNSNEHLPVRRSKKVAEVNLKNNQQHLFLPQKNTIERTYEVTENISEIEETNPKKTGYEYVPPRNKNQTETLFQILSRYKISKDDALPNYALSRKPKAQNFLKQQNSLKPVIKPISYGYNNPNHLPIDPVLAVLLSNYGFYVQGMYGRSNEFKNLYGYLASNNMHNNIPFGTYKIFSDTDSSH